MAMTHEEIKAALRLLMDEMENSEMPVVGFIMAPQEEGGELFAVMGGQTKGELVKAAVSALSVLMHGNGKDEGQKLWKLIVMLSALTEKSLGKVVADFIPRD